MTRRALLIWTFIGWSALLLPFSLPAAELRPSAQKPIINQALVFLQLLDQGRAEVAWTITSQYFREQVDKQTWQKIYQRRRAPLGAPRSRQVAGYRFHSTFDQAQDGLFLQIRFSTDFGVRADVLETVEMYKDVDGKWRVIGYFLEY